MPKRIPSQWDFGELFPPETLRKVLTVGELTESIKTLLERQIGQVWVTGEITNLRLQSSGHAYFGLKDATSQLNCVLFRGEALGLDRAALQDGQKVVLQGDLTVYEPRGQYQLRVVTVELQGIGALQIAFERLKRKLQAEGLFAPERKRPLPRYPQRLGLVTSPTGAAIRDVLHVIRRRHPGLEIVLAPCRVQGPGAAEEIAAAISGLNDWSAAHPNDRMGGLDLILVTRGGGSLEDLWAFNEEIVARAIFHSALPVVSAVGHEIDFTISDFVADMRAATPSAAAEIITQELFASREFIQEARQRLRQMARQRLRQDQESLRQRHERLRRVHPQRRLERQMQRLDEMRSQLMRTTQNGLRRHFTRWENSCGWLRRVKPGLLLNRRRDRVDQMVGRLIANAQLRWQFHESRFSGAQDRLRLLSPHNVLERGYSITMDAQSGQIIRGAHEARPGQWLKTRLKSGEVRSVVAPQQTGEQ